LSFFEPPPPREPPQRSGLSTGGRWNPPDNETGVVVPIRQVIVRREDLVIAFTGIVAYSLGFAGDLVVLWRQAESPDDVERMDLIHAQHGMYRRGELRDDFLRFGVEFGDGRRGTNLETRFGDEAGPERVYVATHGGGGGGSKMSWHYWVRPLPPPGPVALVVEWPVLDVPTTRHEVDAQPILDAAAESEPFWPDDDVDDED